jgi:hypothetical protein
MNKFNLIFMNKQITLVSVALFICSLGVLADELPQITSIDLVGRGLGNTSFGQYKDFCAQESEGIFTWVGTLYYNFTNNEGVNQSFKAYVNNELGGTLNQEYQFNALTADDGVSPNYFHTVQDGGTYPVTYSQKGSDVYRADYKWRINSGGDGYYKIKFNVLDQSDITMSLQKVDVTYANLGSLSVDGFPIYAVRGGEESEGFDPEVYEYNCYIPANATETGVTYFSFRGTKSALNENPSNPFPYPYPLTVSNGDISTINVTGFDNATTNTYTINYKLDVTGINKNDVSKVNSYVAGQILTVAGADAYVVYSVSGTVAANVKSNAPGVTVKLLPGVYVVKANTAETFKVVIK